MLTFSNPRTRAEFSDWPSGSARVQCVFQVEYDAQRGWRVVRTTTDKAGKWCKPKASTYSGQAAIVDGSDGRTYILQVAQTYWFIKVMRSDFIDATSEIGRDAAVFAQNSTELHAELAALIAAANKPEVSLGLGLSE